MQLRLWLDISVEDILWIQLKSKSSNLSMCLAVCYLPPTESSRPIDQEMLFDNLLQQVYCNQNKGYTIILGDFNSRCGHFNDYIEGVDDIVPIVIDNTENLKGDLFIEFLRDINFAMLNGRIGVNDFTYISPRGRSVVDYICVPYEQFKYI